MNNKRAYYYPVPAYLLLLVLVWLGSFFVDVAHMLSDGSYHSSSLISAEGVRWAVRSALPSLNALPWGTVMLFIATYGLLRGSGLTRVLWRMVRLRRLTASELRALSFSLVVTICYLALLYMAAVSPWSLFRGVTDEPSLSPVVQGWAILLFIGVLFASLIYGFIFGNYRSMMDIIASTGSAFTLFTPALVALIPASGVVPCLKYAGVHCIAGISWNTVDVVLYVLPFLYVMVLERFDKERLTGRF